MLYVGLCLFGALVCALRCVVYIPFWIRLGVLRRRHGPISAKRAAIKSFILEGTITHIGYVNVSRDDSLPCSFIACGKFGRYVRVDTHGKFLSDAKSDVLPTRVMSAFDGYLDGIADLVWLLEPVLLDLAGDKRFLVGGKPMVSLSLVPAETLKIAAK